MKEGLTQLALCFTVMLLQHIYETVIVPYREVGHIHDWAPKVFSCAMAAILPIVVWTLQITHHLWEHVTADAAEHGVKYDQSNNSDWHTHEPFSRHQ